MSDISDFKTRVDQAIIQKTDPFSISTHDVGDRFKELADLLEDMIGGESYLTITNPEQGEILVYDATQGAFVNVENVKAEVVAFDGETEVVIDWTNQRKIYFGVAPSLTVIMDTGDGKYQSVPFAYFFDVLPPDQTKVTVNFGYSATGVVIIK